MNLYLMRHAEATPVGSNSGGGIIAQDADRHLTPDGKTGAALIGRVLTQIDPTIGLILTSPLVRAMQTGEIISRELGGRCAMRTSANLSPGFTSEKLVDEILSVNDAGNIVAIGHQPDLSMCISYLIAGSGSATVAMEPGAVACVKIPPRGRRAESQLRWLLTLQVVATMVSQSR